jgi:hypothetical protein
MIQTESELLVCMPLRSPITGASSPRFKYAGKIDLITGETIVDWKSAADIDSFADRKAVGFQAECYALALKRLGYNVTEYQYRVIQTPGIKLSREDHKAAQAKLAEIDAQPASEMPDQFSVPVFLAKSAAEAYEDRCYAWIMERPGERIRTITHPITQSALDQAAAWLWAVKERIQLAERTQSYLTNEAACGAYGSRCPYVDLCGGAKDGADLWDIIERRFEVKPKGHTELNLPADLKPQDIITYSSAAKFSLCEQKYFWGSIMQLQAKNADTSDSLYVGSAMHEGLEYLPTMGVTHALSLIDTWRDANPVMGEAATEKQDQNIARARAMVRAAATYWEYE